MKRNHLIAVLIIALLPLFNSCRKGAVTPIQTGFTSDTSLDAKMAAYGFTPYTGPMDSVKNLKAMTLGEFTTWITQLNAGLKTHSAHKATQSTNGADVDTSIDGYMDQADTTYFTNIPPNNNVIHLRYPYFQSIALPSYFTATYGYENYEFDVYGSTFIISGLASIPPDGSVSEQFTYTESDGIGGYEPSDGSYSVEVEGHLSLKIGVEINGTIQYYSLLYYVANYIEGTLYGTEYSVTSQIYITK